MASVGTIDPMDANGSATSERISSTVRMAGPQVRSTSLHPVHEALATFAVIAGFVLRVGVGRIHGHLGFGVVTRWVSIIF